jgi:UDP:flavonoid glycosyltransferase YjiC (YdhE family)
MRVLFATWAIDSHFAPMAPLGWALQASGHEVAVVCHPSFTSNVARTGLPARACGPDVDLFEFLRSDLSRHRWRPAGPGDTHTDTEGDPARLARKLAGFTRRAESVAALLAPDAVAFASAWRPDLVVFEPTSLVGPLVAAVLGVAAVRHLWAMDFTAPVNGFGAVSEGELPGRFGLDRFVTTGDVTLTPCPEGLEIADDLPRLPIRFVPYNGVSVLPDWLWRLPKRRRRVCVTWGTCIAPLGFEAASFAPVVVRALAELDVEVVLAVDESRLAAFDPLPRNVVAAGRVPLHAVLPSCDAIVHAGTAGTMMTALVCGVPQLTIPYIDDQVFWSQRLEKCGIGRYLRAESTTEAVIREGVARLLSDERTRAAVADARTQAVRRPSPADTVAVLTDIASTRTIPTERRTQ